MSGRPNVEEIDELRSALMQKFQLGDELDSIERMGKELKARHEVIIDQCGALNKVILEKVKSMDCYSTGNFGHDARLLTMLTELVGKK